MDIDLTTEPASIQPLSEVQPTAQAQAIPQEAEGVTRLLPSKRTLANIGLTPEKYAKLLATNLQAPSQVSKEPSVPSTSTANPFSLPLPIQRSQVTVPPPSLPEADSEVSMSLPPLPLLPGMPSEESVSEVGASKTLETTTEAVSVSGLNQPEIITVTLEMAVKSITKEQNRYVCPFISCRKDYAHKSDCNKHVKEHFKPKEQFKCQICQIVVATAKSLLEHTHGIHIKGDPLYKCEKCSSGFYYSSHFSVHKRVCTGPKKIDETHKDTTDDGGGEPDKGGEPV